MRFLGYPLLTLAKLWLEISADSDIRIYPDRSGFRIVIGRGGCGGASFARETSSPPTLKSSCALIVLRSLDRMDDGEDGAKGAIVGLRCAITRQCSVAACGRDAAEFNAEPTLNYYRQLLGARPRLQAVAKTVATGGGMANVIDYAQAVAGAAALRRTRYAAALRRIRYAADRQ
jgi:hypothetical protein